MKRFTVIVLTVMFIFTFQFSSSAADIDTGAWNVDSTLYSVLDGNSDSNSAVEYAFLRVKYDRPSNRIRMLFMLELSSFSDESKAGVQMDINGGEKILLHLDGNSEYNEDKYFAEIKSVSDPRTKTLYMEVTLGIKQGIPDKVILNFNVYDTEGLASNTYSIDITEQTETTTSTTTTTTKKSTSKISKTNKTSKTKTTVTKETSSQQTEISIDSEKLDSNATSYNKNSVVGTAVAAAAIAATVGIGGIQIFRHKKDKKDGG